MIRALLLVAAAIAALLAQQRPESVWLESARDAGRWIDSHRLTGAPGRTWPVVPDASPDASMTLYSGSPGVVLFFLDLYRATGDRHWLAEAVAGAEALAAEVGGRSPDDPAGLYTGTAGHCFVLGRVGTEAEEPRLTRAARSCATLLVQGARRTDGMARWGEVTDIIGGTAGIGLTLLWADAALAVDGALQTAVAAGDALIADAIAADEGAKWAMSPDFPRLMPNFSHGTAGIAYFLARLHGATGQERFREAALAGGRYLQSIADTDGEVCLVFHNEPEGEDLYYLSWCHGPAGTGRTFWELYRITGDSQWLDWTRRSAAALLHSGIPEQRSPGFWNNVGRCCGNAGVAEFLLDLYAAVGDERYRSLAERMAEDLLARGTRDGRGLRWLQAEHRVRPEELLAQTGYMQGAAGIGSLLLRLSAIEAGTAAPGTLPDGGVLAPPFTGDASPAGRGR